MDIKKLLSLVLAINFAEAIFDNVVIEPFGEFYDRRQSLIVTCNASLITDKPHLFFSYRGENHTVPRLPSEPGIYKGNLSVVSLEQSKVMLMCVDLITSNLLSAKLYLFGYPPSIIPQHFKIDLNCRDFNMHRLVCCLNPNISAVERLLGFEESRGGNLKAKLFLSDSDSTEVSMNRSCLQLVDYVAAPSILLHMVIENALGNITYNYSFRRTDIQKPGDLRVSITRKQKTNFSYFISLEDFGEYFVNVTCTSSYPVERNKNEWFKIIGLKSQIITSAGWAPNSKVLCTFFAKVWFGNVSIGHFSDPCSVIVTLYEDRPNHGPTVSPSFVDYTSMSQDGLIYNATIYFSNIPLVDRNGDIIKYMWRCDNCFLKKDNISSIDQQIPKGKQYFIVDKVVVNSTFYITACTKAGCSYKWSHFQIQKLKGGRNFRRRLSIIKDSVDAQNVTLVWNKEDSKDQDRVLLLACSMGFLEDDCSSLEVIHLPRDLESKSMTVEKGTRGKFALISSSSSSGPYKFQWVSCFYNTMPVYEVKEKLANFDHKEWITVKQKCTLSKCNVEAHLKLPSCDQFPDLFIRYLNVKYTSDTNKEEIILIKSNDTVMFHLKNISPGIKKYVMKISVSSSSFNNSILWLTVPILIRHLNVPLLMTIIVCILVFISILFGIFFICKKKIRKEYQLKRKFLHGNQSPQVASMIVPDKPVKLLNADQGHGFTGDNYTYDELDNYSVSTTKDNKDGSTQSTSVSTDDSSVPVDDNNLINFSSNHSMSYVDPPDPEKGHYIHIAIASPKQGTPLEMEFRNGIEA